MYKIAICEDDKDYIDILKRIIANTDLVDMNSVQFFEFYSGEQLYLSAEADFDVVIMDIQMDKMDGYETAMYLREQDSKFLLVFCSGVIKPTPKFFKADAYRYLLKDLPENEIRDEMSEIIKEMITRKQYPYLMCKYTAGKDQVRVYAESILYIAIYHSGSEVGVCGKLKKMYPNETLRVNESINKIGEVFNESCGFVRIHNSYIVNMAHIEHTTPQTVTLNGGIVLNIARSKSQYFQAEFAKFMSSKYKG